MEEELAVQSQDVATPGAAAAAPQQEQQAAGTASSSTSEAGAAAAGAGPSSSGGGASGPAAFQPQDFQCARCQLLLHEPVVLSCGHAVCGATCRPGLAAARAAAEAGAAGGSGAAGDAAAQQAEEGQAASAGVAAAAGGPHRSAAGASGCPACGAHVVPGAQVCSQAQQQLLQLFPAEMALRAAEVARQAGALGGQAARQEDEGAEEGEEGRRGQPEQLLEMLKRGVASAVAAGRGERGGARQLWQDIIRLVEQSADAAYTWWVPPARSGQGRWAQPGGAALLQVRPAPELHMPGRRPPLPSGWPGPAQLSPAHPAQ
jgi:hypothetical protein